MVSLTDSRALPEPIASAYDELLLRNQVEIIKSLYWDKDSGWSFECYLDAPFPNNKRVPEKVMFRVVLDDEFPFTEVLIYSEDDDVRGFPHQTASDGRICLYDERFAQRDTSRLWMYLEWAQEWLDKAATGQLMKTGEPYEIPDFRSYVKPPSMTLRPLLFEEDRSSYQIWRAYIGQQGTVSLADVFWLNSILPISFFSSDGLTIRELSWNPNIIGFRNSKFLLSGRWVLLPDIRYQRHRPPSTIGELEEVFDRYGLNLMSLLKSAWKSDNARELCSFLLVGFPIPKKVGEFPKEICWKSISFDNQRQSKKRLSNRAAKWMTLKETMGEFSLNTPILWSPSENCSSERFSSRGTLSQELRSKKIALFGCGALGSYIAEALVRGGVRELCLYDRDELEYGNLSRHSLSGLQLHSNKAVAVATVLNSICLLGDVRGYPVNVPLNSKDSPEAMKSAEESEIIIDCTTSQSARNWLSNFAFEKGIPAYSLWISAMSQYLTLIGSGDEVKLQDVYERSMYEIGCGTTPVPRDEYSGENAEIVRNTGCWDSTFPARGNHIEMLASLALDSISNEAGDSETNGRISIFRRSELEHSSKPHPLVEVLWQRDFS